MRTADEMLEGQSRPTIEQVAWVFAHLTDHLENTGTFRYLIYHRMGFGRNAYAPLYYAGGMCISNAFCDAEEYIAIVMRKKLKGRKAVRRKHHLDKFDPASTGRVGR